MQKVSKVGFKYREYEYGFELGWDEDGLMEGEVKFELKATRRHADEDEVFEIPAEVSLYEEGESAYIKVSLPTIEGFEDKIIPVSELFEGESEAERFLESIPALLAGDPILGCLIRSGLSSTIGAILSCKNKTSEILWGHGRRLLAIGRCLRVSIPDFVIKTTIRALKCMSTFGV